jgi:hypothetical protein
MMSDELFGSAMNDEPCWPDMHREVISRAGLLLEV